MLYLYPVFDGSNMSKINPWSHPSSKFAPPSIGTHPRCDCTCPCSRCSDSLLECTSFGSLVLGPSYLVNAKKSGWQSWYNPVTRGLFMFIHGFYVGCEPQIPTGMLIQVAKMVIRHSVLENPTMAWFSHVKAHHIMRCPMKSTPPQTCFGVQFLNLGMCHHRGVTLYRISQLVMKMPWL